MSRFLTHGIFLCAFRALKTEKDACGILTVFEPSISVSPLGECILNLIFGLDAKGGKGKKSCYYQNKTSEPFV